MGNEEMANAKRQNILAAAAKVFETHGYAEATVDAVAAEAGIAKGSVYNYFSSKQELFTSVFTESMSVEEKEIVARFGQASSPVDRLMLLFDHWYERYSHHQQIGRLVLECWASAARESHDGHVGPMSTMLNDLYARWREMLTGIISQGQQQGQFLANLGPTMAASVLMGTLDGLTLQGILGVGIVVDQELLLRLKRGFLVVLGATEAAEKLVQQETTDANDPS